MLSNEKSNDSNQDEFADLIKFLPDTKNMSVHKFDQSKKISTYLYALVAGPY